jgi:hypothetical protein
LLEDGSEENGLILIAGGQRINVLVRNWLDEQFTHQLNHENPFQEQDLKIE